jgi:hypothetical protein
MEVSVSAEATIEHLPAGQVRIALREDGAGVATFVGFVVTIAASVYLLMPPARAQPVPLLGMVAVAVVWAVVARRAREEYLLDQAKRVVTARHRWLFGQGENQVGAQQVAIVLLTLGGPDNDRRLVELLGPGRELRLRVPRRVNTLTPSDQRAIGQLLAEYLGVPLRAGT